MTRTCLRPALVLMLACATAAGCGRGERDQEGHDSRDEPVVAVRATALAERRFEDLVLAPGQWRAGGDLVLAAPFAGVIETLSVRVGDHVTRGQVLGRLVTRDSWAALSGAELLVQEARDPAARADAKRALELVRREVVRVPLIAPQAGVVVRRSAEPGAQIADAAEILGLVAARSIVFEAHVPAAASGRVRPGEDAAVIEPSRPPRPATVQRILPMASGADQTTLVWLAPRSESPPPELERFGNAAIVVGTPHRGLAVPDSAVVEDDLTGERRVAVVDSAGRIAWTTVTLGPSLEGWRELLHPALLPGTRVVLEGQRGLPDGTRVTPQP